MPTWQQEGCLALCPLAAKLGLTFSWPCLLKAWNLADLLLPISIFYLQPPTHLRKQDNKSTKTTDSSIPCCSLSSASAENVFSTEPQKDAVRRIGLEQEL